MKQIRFKDSGRDEGDLHLPLQKPDYQFLRFAIYHDLVALEKQYLWYLICQIESQKD